MLSSKRNPNNSVCPDSAYWINDINKAVIPFYRLVQYISDKHRDFVCFHVVNIHGNIISPHKLYSLPKAVWFHEEVDFAT